jgi:hypothetical protein
MVDYGTSIELLRKAGARAWDDLTHGTMGLTSVEFFTPSANPSLLDLVLDKLVGSFAEARLDADPASLIVDLEMIES